MNSAPYKFANATVTFPSFKSPGFFSSASSCAIVIMSAFNIVAAAIVVVRLP